MFLKSEFSNRLVQVSLFAGIVYYITAYPIVFEKARKYFPIKFKKTHHLLIFHTFVFAVLMYLLTYFVFDPIVRVVEGATIKERIFGFKDYLMEVSKLAKQEEETAAGIVRDCWKTTQGSSFREVTDCIIEKSPAILEPPGETKTTPDRKKVIDGEKGMVDGVKGAMV